MELSAVLHEHAARYPDMTPRDVVKLLYQNEFGGGHLIADEAAAYGRLTAELAALSKEGPGSPLEIEAIGNGMVRVHLRAIVLGHLTAEELHRCFVDSARERRGTVVSFEDKLSRVSALVESGVFSFDRAAWETYLDEYRRQAYPMVSHSAVYRAAYGPSYRVVLEKLLPKARLS